MEDRRRHHAVITLHSAFVRSLGRFILSLAEGSQGALLRELVSGWRHGNVAQKDDLGSSASRLRVGDCAL